uniref:Uncharacterized protein n=1 Tax=Pyrodinium bahamense TaxID=73915 RepID=A0A7S0A3R6_9DINO|mmetsp:Transcript_21071/g.58390  ORF Transcript_21071/g.58390 Transcript_21071/m.58390 type:complete len:119 (+) Transcript_21071:59-415(+)
MAEEEGHEIIFTGESAQEVPPAPVQQPGPAPAPAPRSTESSKVAGTSAFAGFPGTLVPEGHAQDAWVLASATGGAAQLLIEDFLWKKRRWTGPLVLGPQPEVAVSAIREALDLPSQKD